MARATPLQTLWGIFYNRILIVVKLQTANVIHTLHGRLDDRRAEEVLRLKFSAHLNIYTCRQDRLIYSCWNWVNGRLKCISNRTDIDQVKKSLDRVGSWYDARYETMWHIKDRLVKSSNVNNWYTCFWTTEFTLRSCIYITCDPCSL